eukprot:m.179528 g.179528  ORF g.179528 m.179528 type:complete len:1421 (+) comp14782_c0_seq1:117-4379(+)
MDASTPATQPATDDAPTGNDAGPDPTTTAAPDTVSSATAPVEAPAATNEPTATAAMDVDTAMVEADADASATDATGAAAVAAPTTDNVDAPPATTAPDAQDTTTAKATTTPSTEAATAVEGTGTAQLAVDTPAQCAEGTDTATAVEQPPARMPNVLPPVSKRVLELHKAEQAALEKQAEIEARETASKLQWIAAAETVESGYGHREDTDATHDQLSKLAKSLAQEAPITAAYHTMVKRTSTLTHPELTSLSAADVTEYQTPSKAKGTTLKKGGVARRAVVTTDDIAGKVRQQLAAYRALRRNMPINATLAHVLGTDVIDPINEMEEKSPEEEARARERELAARIACRVNDLQNLPITTPAHITMRARTELKAYKLLAYQRELKRRLLPLMNSHSSPGTALVVGALKRPSVPVIRTLTDTLRVETQNREFEAARKKEEANNRLASIVRHARDFWAFHQNVRQMRSQITRAMDQAIIQRDKSSDREAELAEKERMRLLMAEDEEGYRKLIDKKKHKRLAYLLEKTDEFMAGMMADIEKHQTNERASDKKKARGAAPPASAAAGPSTEAPVETTAEGDAAAAAPSAMDLWDPQDAAAANDASGKPVTSQYGSAHKVVEKVVKQSSLLVNGTLKEYQIEGLEWLVSLYNNKLNGILADEMGLGKTIQTLALITYLMEYHNENGPHLVIVPLSTLSNWVNEFEKWAPSLRTIIYHGNKNERRSLSAEVASGAFNVVITTYEYIIREKNVLGRVRWRYMIIDEGHRMKNHSCKLQTVLADYYTAPRRLLLTGTPLQNNLPELWSLLNFCLPAIFKSSESFESWFSAPFAGTGEKVEMSEEEKLVVVQRLHKVLRPFMLRRLKKEVEKQLPDKVEYVLRCEMSALQRRMYRFVKLHNFLLVPDTEVDIANKNANKPGQGKRSLQNTVMQLRKICNHPYLFNVVEKGMTDYAQQLATYRPEDLWRCAGKFELLDRIIPKMQATGHRMLIFCQMTQLMTILEDYLVYKGVQYLRLDGTTGAPERQQLLKVFNAPDSPYDIFILSTRAGGLGLNLQSADTVIIFDSDWNPTMDAQAQDRAHRIGQKNEVRVFRLQTINSVEETILEAARHKMNLDKQVIQAGMFNSKSNVKQQKDFLMQVFEEEDMDGDEDEELGDGEINEMLSRTEEELELFNRLDEQRIKDDRATWQTGHRRTRLMEARELPGWALKTDTEVAELCAPKEDKLEEEPLDGSRRQRQRKTISYNEALSEDAWLRAVENGTLDDALEKAKKEADRKRKREEDELASQPAKRAELEATAQRQRLEAQEKERVRLALAAIPSDVLKTINAVYHDVTSAIDREGRLVSRSFWELPNRNDHPDYYKAIKTPMSFEKVHDLLHRGEYKSLDKLISDIDLIVSNVKTFYSAGSTEQRDAELIERALKESKLYHVRA